MVIQIIKYQSDLPDMGKDFINKKIHLVCLAQNALTEFNSYVCALGGMNSDAATELVNKVNLKNEVGTLYPTFNMTIIPLTVFKERNDIGNRAVFKKHVQDCFEANEKYIKSPSVIFDLGSSQYHFDKNLFLVILREEALITEFKFTKKIFFISNE